MLNTSQKEAVNHLSGPLLMLAGAGAGKTHTLTERVAHLIESGNILPERILCVTFTNKAAREMRERIAKRLSRDIEGIHPYRLSQFPLVGTFHALGVYFLRLYGENIGLQKNFTILDEDDKNKILKRLLDQAGVDTKEFPAKVIANAISQAKNLGQESVSFLHQAKSYSDKIKAQIYTAYTQYTAQEQVLDFDDILLYLLRLLQDPIGGEMIRNRFDHIHVDEYQDTNEVQYKIVKNIASGHNNLAVVGDDWQGIYSWRGANIQNILSFEKDYPNARVIKLEENFRSTQNIIESANFLVKNNKSARDKTLWTQNEIGEKISIVVASDDKKEAEYIAEKILAGRDQGTQFHHWAILYRTNAQSRSLEEALIRQNIPYKVYGGLRFYDRKEIKDILAYLRFILNQQDFLALERSISVPSRKIGEKSLEGIRQLFVQKSFHTLEESDFLSLPAAARTGFGLYYQLISRLIQKSYEVEVAELLPILLEEIQYVQYLEQEYDPSDAESRMENIAELCSFATKYTGLGSRESLALFLEDILLLSEANTQEGDSNVVSLMTIHTSKGLEFHSVAVVGMEDGIFPGSRSFLEPKDMEEERRLLYVAMTRAKKQLYLLRARERLLFGQFQSFPPSRFLKEIPSKFCTEELYGKLQFTGFSQAPVQNFSLTMKGNFSPTILKKPPIARSNDVSNFGVGCKVEHAQFGEGTIISLKEEIADIAFPGKGIKKMNIRLAPLKIPGDTESN